GRADMAELDFRLRRRRAREQDERARGTEQCFELHGFPPGGLNSAGPDLAPALAVRQDKPVSWYTLWQQGPRFTTELTDDALPKFLRAGVADQRAAAGVLIGKNEGEPMTDLTLEAAQTVIATGL